METDLSLQYPIGKFTPPELYAPDQITHWIEIIKTLPVKVKQITTGLADEQLETPYRPGGWTIRQVVHHMADSHMNCLVRIKLALTEDNPTIKPYEEADWAKQADYKLPIEPSLMMLDGIHTHLTALFESFGEAEFNRTFYHPASQDTAPLKKILGLYAWHSEHHLVHIKLALKNIS